MSDICTTLQDRIYRLKISQIEIQKARSVCPENRVRILEQKFPYFDKALYATIVPLKTLPLRKVIEERHQPFFKDHDRNTLLHYAATFDKPDKMDMLALFIPVNSQNDFRQTPLMVAAAFGRTDNIKFLLNYKGERADPALRDHHQFTAATHAIQRLKTFMNGMKLLDISKPSNMAKSRELAGNINILVERNVPISSYDLELFSPFASLFPMTQTHLLRRHEPGVKIPGPSFNFKM